MPWIGPSSGFCGMIYVVAEPQRDPEPLDIMHHLISAAAF